MYYSLLLLIVAISIVISSPTNTVETSSRSVTLDKRRVPRICRGQHPLCCTGDTTAAVIVLSPFPHTIAFLSDCSSHFGAGIRWGCRKELQHVPYEFEDFEEFARRYSSKERPRLVHARQPPLNQMPQLGRRPVLSFQSARGGENLDLLGRDLAPLASLHFAAKYY